ncbi:lytic polysaccharide monooxygenase [Cellvibrio sp. UBA7671]|uniref:lytic polysaccharide monooxygenase n=1 Tax=Cellvibrio sp. UBA7671 TaxID=1946312 RepID=UPI002F357594
MKTIKNSISRKKFFSTRLPILATVSAIASIMIAAPSFGHGYLEGERGDLCRQNINTNCSNVDPADTEHPGTFPVGGPPDGQIGSATRPYPQLDEQSANRWYKHGMSSGSNDFHWIIPAQHVSDNYRYYITKPGWNPNVPLARSAFEQTPFCEFEDNGRAPGNPTHNCNVPQRSGYHIILAIWQVSYTGAEFYSLLDANFDGSSQPGDGSSSSVSSSSSSSSSSSPTTGLVVNGNFDAGNFNGWTLTGDNAGVDNNDAYSGHKAYFWSTDAYEQRIDQTVSGLTNGVYSVSAQVKQNTGVPDASRLELTSAGDVQYIDIPHSDNYTEINGTITVSNGSINIAFFQQAAGNTNLQVDNVSIVLLDPDNSGSSTSSSSSSSSSSAGSSSSNAQCNSVAWSASATYQYGDTVSLHGNQWSAKWYTQGQEPGTTGEYGVWENEGSCQ